MNYPIPQSSARAWEQFRKLPRMVANPGLIFDRFVSPERDDREAVLKDVVEAAEKVDTALLQAWQARWACTARAVHAEQFMLRTDWRFITGLGRKGALETGFTFHRYGFPYLPGSSVKGVARAAALLLAGLTEDHPDVMDIFGYVPSAAERDRPARCGLAVFLDAIPDTKPELVPDIMNPHYPEYYQGKAAPTDWQSPVPITFLSVKEGAAFRFAVGWRGRHDAEGQRLHRLAVEWLQRGLCELGAGAKTSAGYGYFVAPSVASPSVAAVSTPATTSLPPPPQPPAEPLVTRLGVIVEIRPDKKRGRLRDAETDREYTFNTQVIVGDMPGKKTNVTFTLRGDQVVGVRRA